MRVQFNTDFVRHLHVRMILKNINLENVTVENGGKYGLLIQGREEKPVTGISLKNVSIKNAATPLKIENCEPINYVNTTINNEKYGEK